MEAELVCGDGDDDDDDERVEGPMLGDVRHVVNVLPSRIQRWGQNIKRTPGARAERRSPQY
jgi:hypothetical protein